MWESLADRYRALTKRAEGHFREPRDARRVRVANGISLALGTITAPYIGVFYLMGVDFLAALVFPISASYILPLFLNARGHFTLSRVIFLTVFNCAITLYSTSLGLATGIPLLYFASACLALVVCDLSERRLMVYGVSLPVVLFTALVAVSPDPLVKLSASVQHVLLVLLVPTTFAILLFQVFYFVVSNRRAERRLDERNRGMRVLLDNTDQGFVTLDRDSRIEPERSAAATQLMPSVRSGSTFAEALRDTDAQTAFAFELGWEQLLSGVLPTELCLFQLPDQIEAHGRDVHLAYKPLRDCDGEINRVLVVLTDVTAQVQRERAEASNRELAALLEHAARDRGGVVEFVADASSLVDRLVCGTRPDAEGSTDIGRFRRVVHTLKGSCGLYDLQTLVSACHTLESSIAETGRVPHSGDLAPIVTRWKEVVAQIAPMLETKGSKVSIARREIDALIDGVNELPRAVIRQRLVALTLEPTGPRLVRLGRQASALAGRLGKPAPRVVIRDHDVRLPRDSYAEFWSAISHVLRNAVDHGIEPPSERERAGKAPSGQLVLSSSMDGDRFVVEVGDDGRGVDWSKVARAAVAHGLPARTRRDLVDALFHDGLSTRTEVSHTSGRGVGMAAVVEAMTAFGQPGIIEVDSEVGQGTTFRFILATRPAALRRSG